MVLKIGVAAQVVLIFVGLDLDICLKFNLNIYFILNKWIKICFKIMRFDLVILEINNV